MHIGCAWMCTHKKEHYLIVVIISDMLTNSYLWAKSYVRCYLGKQINHEQESKETPALCLLSPMVHYCFCSPVYCGSLPHYGALILISSTINVAIYLLVHATTVQLRLQSELIKNGGYWCLMMTCIMYHLVALEMAQLDDFILYR